MSSVETFGLGHQALAQPLSLLRLGAKTGSFVNAGILTVGDLLENVVQGAGDLLKIPGIGKSTVDLVRKRLLNLSLAVRNDGTVNWAEFSYQCGYNLLPDYEIASGTEFLNSFAVVIAGIIEYQQDEVDRLILTERLSRQNRERMTLDAIAQHASVRVTRERVRQREERLLRYLSNAILFDDYNGLDFHFRDSFVSFWRQAAKTFGDRSQLSFEDFIQGLKNIWNVSAEQIFEHLPLITSILTSSAKVPKELRPESGVDPRLFGSIDKALLASPLTCLATGKASLDFGEAGFHTIGDLVDAARSSRLPPVYTRFGRIAAELVKAISSALRQDGTLDWYQYASALNLVLLPESDPIAPEAFLRGLNTDLEHIVRTNATSLNAVEIFRIRTSSPRESRKTLDEAAALLRSHGSSIKREETLLLASLNASLVERDFSASRAFYRPGFLEFWREASVIFKTCPNDFESFCHQVAAFWNLPASLVSAHAETLWAVLKQYPTVRRAGRLLQNVENRGPENAIILRGFRRIH